MRIIEDKFKELYGPESSEKFAKAMSEPTINKELLRQSAYHSDILNGSQKILEEAANKSFEAAKLKHEEDETYRQNILNTLTAIERNTANLQCIVELINNSAENQDKIIQIINDFISLSKETDQQEAENNYNSIMKKIVNLGEKADTMNKLITFGTTVYSALAALGIVPQK